MLLLLLAGCLEPTGTPPTIEQFSCTVSIDKTPAAVMSVPCVITFADPDGDVSGITYDLTIEGAAIDVPAQHPDLAGQLRGTVQVEPDIGEPRYGTFELTLHVQDDGYNDTTAFWTADIAP